jgi:hypothetical protein
MPAQSAAFVISVSARCNELLRDFLLLGGVKQGGDDGRRTDRAVLAGERRLLGAWRLFLAAGHFSLPLSQSVGEAIHMGIDSGQIVTFRSPWRDCIHECADMFNKIFQAAFFRRLRLLFTATCGLTATRCAAIKLP